jgi:hypothetical protein
MKIYSIFTLLFVILFSSCSTNNTAFYDKVLSDFDVTSYFIAIDIRSSAYNGRVIIENNDLYNFLNKTKGWDRKSYKSGMKKFLVHRRVLKINNTDLLKWKFIQVKEITSVYLNSSKGVNSFIKNYFNGSVFKYEVDFDEMHAVINQLFYWKIPVKFDNVSRELLLEN